MKARFAIAGALTAAVALAAPAAAGAAAVAVAPVKPCYRSLEKVSFGGSGYTPNSTAALTVDGQPVKDINQQPAHALTDAAGNFGPGTLTVVLAKGEKVKTYTATDDANPANTASAQLRVSALTVSLRPKDGRPDRRFRIRARGFTSGKRLYAHIVRRGYRRTVRVGRLKGACGKVSARRRLFPHSIRNGKYRVQFDSKRRYSKRTKVKVVRGFQLTP